jgi:hypothetical protein
VGQRPVRARSHDRREAWGLRAEPAHPQLQLDRDVALAAPNEAVFQHASQRLVGELAGSTDVGDLARFLDRPQPLHRARAPHQLPALPQQLAQPPVSLDRDARLVEPQLARAAGKRGGDRLDQLPGDDLPLEGIRYLFARLGRVAEVGVEAVRAQLRRETWPEHERQAAAACEAGQIADVDERLHQQQVHPAPLQLAREALSAHAGGVAACRLAHVSRRSRCSRSCASARP